MAPAKKEVPTPAFDVDDETMTRQIISAAEQCFRKYGVHRTRMEDIAQRVGLVRPNLYRYVESKEALILRVIIEHTIRVDEERRRRIPLRGPVGPIITKSITLGVELASADEFEKDMMSPQNIDIAARFVASNQGDDDLLPRPDYWYPIFEYGRRRGEIRDDLDDRRTLLWIGAITILLLERRELFTDADRIMRYVDDYVTPALLAPAAKAPKR